METLGLEIMYRTPKHFLNKKHKSLLMKKYVQRSKGHSGPHYFVSSDHDQEGQNKAWHVSKIVSSSHSWKHMYMK